MKNLDRIIQLIRENMVANAPGTSGAYTSSGDPKTVGGFDTVMDGRSRVMRRLPSYYRKVLQKRKPQR